MPIKIWINNYKLWKHFFSKTLCHISIDFVDAFKIKTFEEYFFWKKVDDIDEHNFFFFFIICFVTQYSLSGKIIVQGRQQKSNI